MTCPLSCGHPPSLSLPVLADSGRGGGLLFAPGRDEVAARCAACSPDTGTVARRARRSDVCLCGLPGEEREEEEEEEKDSKTSSSCGRAHRRQRQLCVLGWFFWFCSSRCVPSFCRHAQHARHLGRCETEGQLSVACAWLVLLVMVLSRCVPFYCRQALGQVVLARRCATTGAGFGPDSVLRCPWRLHRCSSWTRLRSLRQVPWSRQCKSSGSAAIAGYLLCRPLLRPGAEANSHDPGDFTCCRTLGG